LASTAGTNYGENNSLMVITRNYSGPVLLTAGAIANPVGLPWPAGRTSVEKCAYSRQRWPVIYLFGVIGHARYRADDGREGKPVLTRSNWLSAAVI